MRNFSDAHKFLLFVIGGVISSIVAVTEIIAAMISATPIDWVLATALLGAALLPALLLGFPYLDSRFHIKYDGGLKIEEERNGTSG
ncbi:MAG: hypothetical protein LBN32_00410 [Helicobacteraceae bacterium]|jgi:hypothetical protein|nr:hypothetical protein [Helicobacteraceae bacterium]